MVLTGEVFIEEWRDLMAKMWEAAKKGRRGRRGVADFLKGIFVWEGAAMLVEVSPVVTGPTKLG